VVQTQFNYFEGIILDLYLISLIPNQVKACQ